MYIRVLIMVSFLKLGECHNNFFGTAELMKNSAQPRRSRLLSEFIDNSPADYSRSGFVPMSIPLTSKARSFPVSSAEPATEKPNQVSESFESDEGPIPTADTMQKYARIFKMDTTTLNEKQKMILQRIVQRIARLNGANPDEESINLTESEGRARRKNGDDRKKTQKKSSTTTIEVVTEPTRATSKHKPSSLSSNTTSSSSSSNGAQQKKKVAASNNFISISTVTARPTMPTIASKEGKSKVTQANDLTLMNATSVDLGNISTTSIVDILSTDNARENFYVRRPSPSTITTVHNKIQPQKVSFCHISYFACK